MRIKVQIGRWTQEYAVVATDAPIVYDGFGTFTIRDDYPIVITGSDLRGRLVLIRVPHFEWQTTRYCSGLYVVDETPEAEDPKINEGWVIDLLLSMWGEAVPKPC